METDLKKIKDSKKLIVDKLDKYEKDGINSNQIEEFNSLCSQEFELCMQESLIKMVDTNGSIEFPAPISRKIKLNDSK